MKTVAFSLARYYVSLHAKYIPISIRKNGIEWVNEKNIHTRIGDDSFVYVN